MTIPTTVFTPSQGTIEAWVKPTRDPYNIGSQYIQMITDVAETGNNGLVLALNTDGRFYLQAGTGSGLLQAYSTTIASINNWYYVVGKWDSSEVSMYVNGVKQGTVAGTPAVTIDTTPTIGRESQASQRWFDGIIDDVRISNKARTDSDILAAYTSNATLPLDSSTTYKLNLDSSLKATYQVYQPTNWYFNTPSGLTNQVEPNTDSAAPFGPSNVLHLKGNGAAQATDFIDLFGLDNFILSGYLKTSDNPSDGAYLNVYWYDSNKTLIAKQKYLGVKNTDWQRYIVTLTPSDVSTSPSYAKVEAATYGDYDAYFDNIQFEKSNQARDYNLLENSSFEKLPLQTLWSVSDGTKDTVFNDGTNSYTGSYDARIYHSSVGSSYFESQSVIPVNNNQWYTLSGHIMTSGFSASGANNGARLHAWLYDANGDYVNDFTLPIK